jgi:hypothetical protein
MQVLSAIVKFSAGKVFAGKFGDRQSIKLEFAKGDPIDVWFDAGDPRYCSLKKGEVVQVIRNGDKYTVAMPDDEEPENEAAATPQASPAIGAASTLDEQRKAEIFAELCTRAKIIRTCHIQIQQLFTHQETGEVIISEETIQKYATTLYLDLKKFWS